MKRFSDNDYDADWSKLPRWKREFEQKNPQSRCVIKKKAVAGGKNMYVGPCYLIAIWTIVIMWAPCFYKLL